jgi:hypothetical protein
MKGKSFSFFHRKKEKSHPLLADATQPIRVHVAGSKIIDLLSAHKKIVLLYSTTMLQVFGEC